MGCLQGLRDRRAAPQGVGRATTRAVVLGCEAILVLDAFWALVLPVIRLRRASTRRSARRSCSTAFTLDVPDGETTVLIGSSGHRARASRSSTSSGCSSPTPARSRWTGEVVPDLDRDGLTALRRQHRLCLPVRRAVRLDDGGGEHPRWDWRGGARPRTRSRARDARASRLVGPGRDGGPLSRGALGRHAQAGRRSPARSPSGRATFCTTSRPPASIPSPRRSSTSSCPRTARARRHRPDRDARHAERLHRRRPDRDALRGP